MHAHPSGEPGFIDLLRHGEPRGGARYRGHLDDPLSERGWQQMREACAGATPWRQLVSSPLLRCRAFAEALAAEHELPCRVEPDLREISFGDWEGLTASQVQERDAEALQRYWQDPVRHTPPGGEPLTDCHRRVGAVLDSLLDEAEGDHLLVIAHGGIIRLLLARVLEMPLHAVLRLEVANASLSRLRVQRDINGRLAPSLVFHGGRP
ncbi:histidine phosphatase family protein [Alkalilimnicola sp. S0819]|uniref:histidine phosphatase family protein n=1 Tax=Alkalilimnicola sp. S0819 TaxID=2613922 RepID=UPI001261B15F|nr:alpha-ribazole phosphatase family protein [Alkalilimnicola sp. S0819]KAB7623370.1 alpha-ribazole phosphatase family protein [Alkalilimnicola sp. S0819]MPQ16910.1 histidine phosphatase family protein [Alkalilimnicola sp. S0819]